MKKKPRGILWVVTLMMISMLCIGCGEKQEEEENFVRDYFGKKMEIGDFVYFGTYEQDGDSSNGPEPIKWVVEEVSFDTKQILLLSQDCLEHMSCTMGVENYADIEVYQWLNGTFYENAFTQEEKYLIAQEPKIDCWKWYGSGRNSDSFIEPRYSKAIQQRDNIPEGAASVWVLGERWYDKDDQKIQVIEVFARDILGTTHEKPVEELSGVRPQIWLDVTNAVGTYY